ncbi:hypothetical protein DLJ47_01835 [Micromonospora sp. S4605]|uniref:hypothetical protein n=1 Tax=Micromonospora sp. S4605 TaxID=1420897 RepID=UPI000D701455|nr:hypothetical protein [Micromonospora sp. S4605]PWU57673.1 hypothetical protein DLJ47_01835 [Micromonospora sp. S4605]
MMEEAPLGFLVKHDLGKASGGLFNLEQDLHHLEVHFGPTANFAPDATTMVGILPATIANISGRIPAVGSFQVDSVTPGFVRVVAVDRAGNKSNPSEAAPCSPRRLKDEYIDSLTVSKITAGTISTTWLLAGEIKTAESGARVEMTSEGLRQYNTDGILTVDIASDGNVMVSGEYQTDTAGARIAINPGGARHEEIRFYGDNGVNAARIFSNATAPYGFLRIEGADYTPARGYMYVATDYISMHYGEPPNATDQTANFIYVDDVGVHIRGDRLADDPWIALEDTHVQVLTSNTVRLRVSDSGVKIADDLELNGIMFGGPWIESGGTGRRAGVLNSGKFDNEIWFSWSGPGSIFRIWVDGTNVVSLPAGFYNVN